MSDAPKRRGVPRGGEDPAQRIRFAVVVLCVLATACIYAACIVVVMGGHVVALFSVIPWLAAAALGTLLVLTISALLGASHSRLRNRQQRTVARIEELVAELDTSDLAQRAELKRRLVAHLDITRDALNELVRRDPSVSHELVAGGLAGRVERELSGNGPKWHRVAAAGVLGLLGAESSVPALERALADTDGDVVYAAAQALSLYASPGAYGALLSALTAQRLPESRIATLLEGFRCPLARELIECLADSSDARARYWAAYLLGSLADPRSAPVIERLTRDPEEEVRANAAKSLASFPNPASLSRLLEDESWIVRSHAAKAAGASGQKGLAGQLAGLLEDHSWWVRQNATIALASLGDDAIAPLIDQLQSDDRFARNKAAEALIRGGYAAQQIEIVKSGSPGHERARRILIDLGRAEAVRTIVSATERTSDPAARQRLLAVLQEIEHERANGDVEQLAEVRQLQPPEQLPRLEKVAQL